MTTTIVLREPWCTGRKSADGTGRSCRGSLWGFKLDETGFWRGLWVCAGCSRPTDVVWKLAVQGHVSPIPYRPAPRSRRPKDVFASKRLASS